jgi:hypothetical protein
VKAHTYPQQQLLLAVFQDTPVTQTTTIFLRNCEDRPVMMMMMMISDDQLLAVNASDHLLMQLRLSVVFVTNNISVIAVR